MIALLLHGTYSPASKVLVHPGGRYHYWLNYAAYAEIYTINAASNIQINYDEAIIKSILNDT